MIKGLKSVGLSSFQPACFVRCNGAHAFNLPDSLNLFAFCSIKSGSYVSGRKREMRASSTVEKKNTSQLLECC
jgi:hypothetical protein